METGRGETLREARRPERIKNMTQKEIKAMPCEDITAAGDERLAEIRREGIAHTVWSYGADGRNAGLVFTNAGKVYKITARSSNIFSFR